jgi:hypothetical protein
LNAITHKNARRPLAETRGLLFLVTLTESAHLTIDDGQPDGMGEHDPVMSKGRAAIKTNEGAVPQ